MQKQGITPYFTARYKRIVIVGIITSLAFSLSTCEKNGGTPIPESLPAVVSFSVNIQPMFTGYCALSGCHVGSQAAAGLNLSADSSYADLFKRGGQNSSKSNMIDTLNPSNSRLYTALSSPMPPWGELIKYDTDLILKWIQQGAKNN